MRNRAADVPYCNVNQKRIADAIPELDPTILAYAYEWMHDRYQIHVKKDVERLPAPWTVNPILQQVKFCNVRREHDRQSVNLINNIANNTRLRMVDKMFNCVLFRMFNLWEPIEAMGGPWTIAEFANIDLAEAQTNLQKFEAEGGKIFTNAFNTGGLKQCLAFPEAVYESKHPHKKQREGGLMVNVRQRTAVDPGAETWHDEVMDFKDAKVLAESCPDDVTIEGWEPYMPMRVVRSLKAFVNKYPDFFKTVLAMETPVQAYLHLKENIEGLGEFLAYQMWVDFTYCPEYPFSENEFTVAGPGCARGIDLLFTNKNGMNHEECLFWLRDYQDVVFAPFGYKRADFWSAEAPEDQSMNVMQLENLFCEVQKYARCKEAVANGEKPRGKVGYDGRGTPEQGAEKAYPVAEPKKSTNLLALLRR